MAQHDLYFISGSPPCWSVMLALEVKGLDYQPRRLDNARGEQKSPDFLAVNPRGKVPVLTSDEGTVCETFAILAYLDAAHPEPPLFGTNPAETARIWQAVCDCDDNLRQPVGEISRPLFRGKAQEFAKQITDAASIVQNEFALLETRLAAGPWLTGERVSAADLVVYPVLMQLLRAVSRDDSASLDLPFRPLNDHFPKLFAWLKRLDTLPGYDNAYPPHWK